MESTRSRDSGPDGGRHGRRAVLKAIGSVAAATGSGLATVSGASGSAAAASRSSYTIRTGTSEETTVFVADGDEPGPTVMVVGGMHGDEPAGYESASLIAQWGVDRGRLVVLPEAFKPAIESRSRGVDGRDLNREFPPGSEPESALARSIWGVVTDEAVDFLFDLHSSHGVYDDGDGDGVGQAVFATAAGDADRHRRDLQSYLNETLVANDAYAFTGWTPADDDGRPMLRYKVGADRGTPALIFETYRGLDDVRQRMLTTSAVHQFLRNEGLIDETVTYGGDAVAVNAPTDGNDSRSGLTFSVANGLDQAVSLTDVEISPVGDAADEIRDTSSEEGPWLSEVHVDADERDGVTDVHHGVSLPAAIDLDADGHSDAASTEPVLSEGSTATVSLYEFTLDGDPVSLRGESVAFALSYELADGTRGETSFTASAGRALVYGGDARAVDAPADDNDDRSGVVFSVTNATDQRATILDLTVDPANAGVDELTDHSYGEGPWESEVHVAADVRDGLTDVNYGAALPGTIDLDADGHGSEAQRNAVLSSGSTAKVSLYQFESDGDPVDLVGETVTVSLRYELADGRRDTAVYELAL